MNIERLKRIQEQFTIISKDVVTHLSPITYARALLTTAHNFAHNLHYTLREEFKLSPVKTKAVELAFISPQHLALVGIITDNPWLFGGSFYLMSLGAGAISMVVMSDPEVRQCFFGPPINSATPEVTN